MPTAISDLPASVEASLDALLDETAEQDAPAVAASAADPDRDAPEQSASVRTEPAEDADGLAAQGHEGTPDQGNAPEPGTPDDAGAGDDAAATVAATTPQPTVEELTAELAQHHALIQQIAAAETSRQQQAALAKAEADYTAFMSSLEEMDPEDAANAKLTKVMEFASDLLKKQQATQHQTRYVSEKQAAIDFIAAGGRVRNGQRIPNAAKPIPPEELAVLADFEHPMAMERYADRVLTQRTQQTAAARTALANQRREAGEGLVGGGAGSRGASPQIEEPTSLDELFDLQDATYGGSPLALRNRAAGLSP